MTERSCDINDVIKAATNLSSLSCTIGGTFFSDGTVQLKFTERVSLWANEVIAEVEQGVISAWEGLQAIQEEHSELLDKVGFYAQNGVTVAGGVMQVQTGARFFTTVPGAPVGGIFMAHGGNNIYEGLGNIYNGPGQAGVVGPLRKVYRQSFKDSNKGDMAYYSLDLLLSGLGMFRNVRKPGSVQLMVRDPINYERAYQQAGTSSLLLEALVDAMTINSMLPSASPDEFQDSIK